MVIAFNSFVSQEIINFQQTALVLSLIHIFIGAADEYGSGLTLERPALQKVTEAVVAGRVDVVLVHNLTRIGREWGMTQSYIDLLTRHKVKLLCIRDRLLFDENGATPILTIKNAECPL